MSRDLAGAPQNFGRVNGIISTFAAMVNLLNLPLTALTLNAAGGSFFPVLVGLGGMQIILIGFPLLLWVRRSRRRSQRPSPAAVSP